MPIISFISISSSIGTSEEELKVHFKEKHKINTVKPFLIKRICRICDYDKSTSNDQLVKHITDEHPRSDYGDEDEGNIYFLLFRAISVLFSRAPGHAACDACAVPAPSTTVQTETASSSEAAK